MTYTNNQTAWLFLLGIFMGAAAITFLRIEFNKWKDKFVKSQKGVKKDE